MTIIVKTTDGTIIIYDNVVRFEYTLKDDSFFVKHDCGRARARIAANRIFEIKVN